VINPEAKRIRDKIAVYLDEVGVCVDALLALVPEVADPPPPPPPDPIPTDKPVYGAAFVNMARAICTEHAFPGGGAYWRAIRAPVFTPGEPQRVRIHVMAGGNAIAFAHPEYGYTLNGVEVHRFKPTGNRYEFMLDAATLPAGLDGLCQEGFTAYDASGQKVPLTESVLPFFIRINRNGGQKHLAIWQTGTFDMSRNGAKFEWGIIPVALVNPRPRPIKGRAGTPFTGPLQRTKLTRIDLVPQIKGDHYYPQIDRHGFWSFASNHVYEISEIERATAWPHPAIDGPRGVGTVAGPLWCWPGRKGGGYATELKRLAHVHPDGRVETLFGEYETFPASYWEDKAKMARKWRGKWEGVSADRQDVTFGWGGGFVPHTLEIDPKSALVDGENTHFTGPKMLFVCRQFNRVLELEFDPRSHATEVVAREVQMGFTKPWALALSPDAYYVTDEGASRIYGYDIRTHAKLFEIVHPNPQGIAFHDGHLYVGGKAQPVWKINLATQEKVPFVQPTWNSFQSEFMYLWIGASEFGAPALFATTFQVQQFGRAQAWSLDGTPLDWQTHSYKPYGAGGATDSYTYSTAGGVAHAALIHGGMDIGLSQFTLTEPGDPVIDEQKYIAGRNEFHAKGYHVTHSHWLDVDPPRGVSANIDYYLDVEGR
jgi:hypothetical protein